MHNWLRFEPLKPDLSCYISLNLLIAVCESQHLRSAPFTASDIPHISASSISLFLPRLVFCVCPSLSLSLPCHCCSVSPLVQLRSVTPEGQIGQVLFSHLNNSTSFFHKTFSRGDRETCNGTAFLHHKLGLGRRCKFAERLQQGSSARTDAGRWCEVPMSGQNSAKSRAGRRFKSR